MKGSQQTSLYQPKYLRPATAAIVYGVHKDFFRKNSELRRSRVVINSKTHLYPVEVLDAFFANRVVR
jgi:hypothetical protein